MYFQGGKKKRRFQFLSNNLQFGRKKGAVRNKTLHLTIWVCGSVGYVTWRHLGGAHKLLQQLVLITHLT